MTLPASAGRALGSPGPRSAGAGSGTVRRTASPAEEREFRRRDIVLRYVRDGMSEALARKMADHELGA